MKPKHKVEKTYIYIDEVEDWIYKLTDKEMDELKQKGTLSKAWLKFKYENQA
jgi:hypothetical protein